MYSAQLQGQRGGSSVLGSVESCGLVSQPVWASPVEDLGWDMMCVKHLSVKMLYKKDVKAKNQLDSLKWKWCKGFRRDSRKGVSGLRWPWCYHCRGGRAWKKFQQLWLKQVFWQEKRLSMGLTSLHPSAAARSDESKRGSQVLFLQWVSSGITPGICTSNWLVWRQSILVTVPASDHHDSWILDNSWIRSTRFFIKCPYFMILNFRVILEIFLPRTILSSKNEALWCRQSVEW